MPPWVLVVRYLAHQASVAVGMMSVKGRSSSIAPNIWPEKGKGAQSRTVTKHNRKCSMTGASTAMG